MSRVYLKILYIISTLKRCGPTIQLYNLIKYIDRSQFEPYLLTLSPEPEDSCWQDYEALGAQVESLGLSRLEGLLLARKRIRDIVRRIQPDLIHTQGIRGDIFSAVLNYPEAKICTIRNFPQEDYLMTYGSLLGRLMVFRHIYAMRQMDVCIGVSKAVCNNLSVVFGLKNVQDVRNGVDTEVYHPVHYDEKRALRATLGLPSDARIWVSSGHLNTRKNPLFLLRSFQSCYSDNESQFLVFLGSGPVEDELKRQSAPFSNIMLMGRVKNVAEYLQASDYFVSASQAEGLPNAVLEALACGLPVLLSDIDPHKEIVAGNPKIGGLFDLGCQNQLGESFFDMEERDYKSMSLAARALIDKQLSAKKMSEDYQKIYSQILKLHS